MSVLTRREWNKLALSGLAAAALPSTAWGRAKQIDSKFRGVQIGVQSYSFRDRSLDDAIKGMAEVGLGSCELYQGHAEPQELLERADSDKNAREEIRKWRLSVPLEQFHAIRQKFDRAGINLYAYNYSFKDDYTDPEIERGFQMARALGVRNITASSNVSTVKRIDNYAKRYKIRAGMHNHDETSDPNEFATIESLSKALEGSSPYIAINLDIGHFTAANYDAVEYLKQHHDRIVTLHIKDRKRNHGDNMPFGQGETPIGEVLALLRDNKWPIPANIEYEYDGKNTIEELKRCLAFCKEAIEKG